MDKMELEQRLKKLDIEAREALVPYIYAMSDMHGEMEAFEHSMAVVDLSHPESKLILCGDYMPPPDGDFTMIREIMRLQDEHPGRSSRSWGIMSTVSSKSIASPNARKILHSDG